MPILSLILNLLPKISAATAALPEFVALIAHAKATLTEPADQAKLQAAYDLSKIDRDDARDELAALVAAHAAVDGGHTGG